MDCFLFWLIGLFSVLVDGTVLFCLGCMFDMLLSSNATNVSTLTVLQCDPNLQVYNVFIGNVDERLPRIAFFTTRGIKAGEELTFDYKMTGETVFIQLFLFFV